jgi:hypothetical protein
MEKPKINSEQLPRASAIEAGTKLSRETASTLGEVFSRKLIGLSMREELTAKQKSFIGAVLDVGTRNIVYGIDYNGLPLPSEQSEEAITLRKGAKRLIDGLEHAGFSLSQDSLPGYQDSVVYALPRLTGLPVGLNTHPDLRAPIEDYAIAVMPYFGAMVADNGDALTLDRYMAGNMQYLLAHFEQVEAEEQRLAAQAV